MKKAQKHDPVYYVKSMIGGMLACGITHTALVPFDVAKCKRQIDPKFSTNIVDGIKKVRVLRQATLGWAPTFIGYSLQGLGKFGFYQIFKDIYKGILGQQSANKYKKIGWSISSSLANIIACVLLAPWEIIRIKIQLSIKGHEYPTQLRKALKKIINEQGTNGLLKGISPLCSKRIPYSVVKFVAFECFVQFFYDYIFTKGKQSYNKATQLGITFASGFSAGTFCAVISHPADTILSKLYSHSGFEGSVVSRIIRIYSRIGFSKVWTGLLKRIIMIGTLNAFQWSIYDSFKTSVGLQTTGRGSKH